MCVCVSVRGQLLEVSPPLGLWGLNSGSVRPGWQAVLPAKPSSRSRMSKLQLVAHRQLVRLDLRWGLISMGNGYEFKIFAGDSTQGHEKY